MSNHTKHCEIPWCGLEIPKRLFGKNVIKYTLGGIGLMTASGQFIEDEVKDPRTGKMMQRPASKHKLRVCKQCFNDFEQERMSTDIDQQLPIMKKLLDYYKKNPDKKPYKVVQR